MVYPTSQVDNDVAKTHILDLRGQAGHQSDSSFLRNQIIAGLTKQEVTVPGKQAVDSQYSYCKTLPTLVLYDDHGLSLYDKITSLEEYYPFKAELRILQTFGPEIAHRIFGLQLDHDDRVLDGKRIKELGIVNGTPINRTNQNGNHAPPNFTPTTTPNGNHEPKDRWGDHSVGGQHNNGVNGNLGLSESTPQHGCVIELGAGSLKKTAHLLGAVAGLLPRPAEVDRTANGRALDNKLSNARLKTAQYFALDVVHAQLVDTLKALPTNASSPTKTNGKVHAQGICATYDQGLQWISTHPTQLSTPGTRRCILWLGSSIGNLSRRESMTFLRDQVVPALMEGDTILIGVDNCQDSKKVEVAYHDPHGVTADFELNAVTASGRELGIGAKEGWTIENFDYVSRYNVELSRHEAFLRARCDISFKLPFSHGVNHFATTNGSGGTTISLTKGELIGIEHSYKFSHEMMYKTFIDSGLRLVQQWTDPSPGAFHTLYLAEKPRFAWPSTLPVTVNGATVGAAEKEEEGGGGKGCIPTREQWKTIWSAWDLVTTQMIPKEMLFKKPIDLRHICLFYLGHIPTFADIHISRYLKEPFTEPRHFSQIFERGIDPNMENPHECHDHSIVPEKDDDWPTIEEVFSFRDRFRQRLFKVYADKIESSNGPDRYLGRVLTLIYEHEALHLETLLYMLTQMPAGGVLPPPGFMAPDWTSLSRAWHSPQALVAGKVVVVDVPATTFDIGQTDIEAEDKTKSFDLNHSYGWDNESPRRQVSVEAFKIESVPITNRRYLEFVESLGSRNVSKCDIPASWIKVDNRWFVRTVFGAVDFEVADVWPCQASGVQLDKFAKSVGGRLPSERELRLWYDKYCHVDSAVSNIGLRNWHVVPATSPTQQADDKWSGGSNGGVWEWTGTALEAHEGFVKSVIYPGYTSDFFDGHHLVVLGGSWATIPRIASRSSFRNWYQANYPYVFAGARVVYDA